MRPYQQIPFQWSVHVLKEHGGEPEHHEFLATDASDPRREFITSLCAALGKRSSTSFTASSLNQEGSRNSLRPEWLPEFAERIEKIQRLWDLIPVIRGNVYHSAFAGSYSLKDVLAAFVPEMTYVGMQVADGQSAGPAWKSMVLGCLDHSERDINKKALLDYCGQDTLVMAKMIETLSLPLE